MCRDELNVAIVHAVRACTGQNCGAHVLPIVVNAKYAVQDPGGLETCVGGVA